MVYSEKGERKMATLNRWVLDGHCLEDRKTQQYYYNKDKAIVHMFNVVYNELLELREELKEVEKK